MFDLTGRVALVTGASGGIGSDIARALHAQGATVALSGTREGPLEDLKAELGERAHVVPCDLSDLDAVDSVAKRVTEATESLDILVNNAGVTKDGLFMRMGDDDWDMVLKINLTAAFRLTRASLRGMMKKRWGRIVSITSIVGHTGNPGQGNYVATKAGITGMTKALATEVARRNITVNCVAPGMIETAMTSKLNDEQKAGLLEKIAMGRMGKGEDIAAAVVYLASDEAGYVTGQTIHVNGGMAMF